MYANYYKSDNSPRLREFVSFSRSKIPLLLVLLLTSCGGSSDSETATIARQTCEGFSDWATSEYVLPYPVGNTYRLNQGNCSGFGHSDFWQYGYDFEMPVGTLIVAARDGEVVHAQDGAVDGDTSRTNLITVKHIDGTVALYSHLTLNGVQVVAGQPVMAGDVIGQSGNTGNTGGLPHLHFSLHPCDDLPGLPGAGSCATIPVNFRNTEANPFGPQRGQSYTALPY